MQHHKPTSAWKARKKALKTPLKKLDRKAEVKRLKSALDRACNEYVKRRDNRTCQRCGSQPKKVDWAHFYGRGKWALRWDPDNSLTLCSGCHMYLDTQARGDFEELMLKRLGQERYDSLTLRRFSKAKLDPDSLEIKLRYLKSL